MEIGSSVHDELKNRAFASYVTTHLAPRKDAMSPDTLRLQARYWNKGLRRFLPADKAAQIVDIGCGCGSVVWWLHQLGYASAEGVDVSAEQVSAAQQLGIANVYHADLRTFLKDREASYDAVLARDVFEHFDRASLVDVLEQVRVSLKAGGVLVFQVPNAESPFGSRIRYGDITHELAFTASSISQLMHLAGFRDTRIYPVEPAVYGAVSLARVMAWKV